MSASTAGALKAYIETLGLGVAAFRDVAPDNQPLPYIVIQEGISVRSEPAFNSYDDPEVHVSEAAQVVVCQQWRDPLTGAVVESYTLADAVQRALDGKRTTTAPTWVGGMTASAGVRIPDVEDNTVRTVIDVEIRRTLYRIGETVPGAPPPPEPQPVVDTYGGY